MARNLRGDHWLETYKSLLAISREGFKFLILINGGAAVALLAYLGNIAGQSRPVPDMRAPMLAFLVGLGLCGLALLGSYITQLRLLYEIGTPAPLRHSILLWITLSLYVLSLIAFMAGSWQAVIRFQ